MLREGHRLRAEGRDVVIGFVETHGRSETERQIGDLETVPRLTIVHGSVSISELDVDAVLARKPEIVLVDELAHTNAPGSPRAKRWADVQLLLDAGIDVLTTLNIQHLESLNDIVESITGVKVRETIPDRVLDDADEVQLVDVPVDTLLERMEAGRIYPPALAQQAIANFFRPGNLTALRELALRRTAAGVDERLESYMRENAIDEVWPAAERVLVWLKSGSSTGSVLRRAWRIASGLRGELVVAIPAHAGSAPEVDSAVRLAEDLGAVVHRIDGDDVDSIAEVVRRENANILVMAYGAQRGALSRFARSPIDQLHDRLENVDIYIVEANS
jgi:two-component system sensor histidine kinase KdpD